MMPDKCFHILEAEYETFAVTKIPTWQESIFRPRDVVAILGPGVLFRWLGQTEMGQGQDYQRTMEEWCWWLQVITGGSRGGFQVLAVCQGHLCNP